MLFITGIGFAAYTFSSVSVSNPEQIAPGSIQINSIDASYLTVSNSPVSSTIYRTGEKIESFQINFTFNVEALSLRMSTNPAYVQNIQGEDYFIVFSLNFEKSMSQALTSLFSASLSTDSEGVSNNTLSPKFQDLSTTTTGNTSFSVSFPFRESTSEKDNSNSSHAFLAFFDQLDYSVRRYDCVFHFSVSGQDFSDSSLNDSGLLNPGLSVRVVHDIGGTGL